ncbi:MAG: hypothetical protein JWQ35_2373 [Bacteriovoracaceae bacterium]|nr:hypothetical protein [Bacteriovoracaceae bacterium]
MGLQKLGIISIVFCLHANLVQAGSFTTPTRVKAVVCLGLVAAIGAGVASIRPEYKDYRLPHGTTRVAETFGDAVVPDLPSSFFVKENILTVGDSLRIVDDGHLYGTVREKVFSFTKSFSLEDPNEQVIANAKQEFFAWGVKIDVTDVNGKKIGAIQEEIFKSIFKPYTTYKILDANDNIIAESQKTEWLETEFNLTSSSGEDLAHLHRGAWSWPKDNWAIEIYQKDKLDPRVLLMIAAYKTSVDNDRRKAEEDERKAEAEDETKKNDYD